MNLRRFVFILAALWQCHALFASGDLAAGATNDPVDPLQLKYNLATTLEAYDKVGRKNPKWDDAVRKSFMVFARVRSWTNAVPPELINELYTNLYCLSDCDDPLVRYLLISP